MLSLAVRQLWKRFRRGGDSDHWALRNVDFSLPRGGALGVIGANGSGKSTLLQIVAGVLRPTVGRASSEGRMVAILNPTAGFHPDLPGRANVRMLGALHGLSSREVELKLPAIIEFSGLAAFIDQPLRTYSSGMMIRLGFSTAAHLEPEVFVVDEVLSAGDLAFQRQAASMARQLRQGGTTLLVSTHALGDLATLCDRLMLLERGEVREEGSAEQVVASYLQRVDAEGGRIEPASALVAGVRPTSPSRDVVITGIVVNGQRDPARVAVRCGEPLEVRVEYEALRAVADAVFRAQFFRNDGLFVHGQNTARAGLRPGVLEGRGVATVRWERFGLLAGDYYLALGVWPDEYRSYTTGEAYDHRPSACIVTVEADRSMGGGVAGFPCRWEVEARPVLAAVGAAGEP